MQHIILEVKANQRSALILQTKRRVKPCNPGQVKKISEQHRLPVPVNGVIFNMPVRYLLPKALRQYPVKLGGHRWIAEKP